MLVAKGAVVHGPLPAPARVVVQQRLRRVVALAAELSVRCSGNPDVVGAPRPQTPAARHLLEQRIGAVGARRGGGAGAVRSVSCGRVHPREQVPFHHLLQLRLQRIQGGLARFFLGIGGGCLAPGRRRGVCRSSGGV